MKRALAIPLLLLALIWPMESTLAAVAMVSAHECCQPKAKAETPTCHEHAGQSVSTVKISARHEHEQCPMDCCSKRQASGNAISASAAEVRTLVAEALRVVVHSREAHTRLALDAPAERGPPFLALIALSF